MKNFLDRTSDFNKPSTNNFKFYVSASQELQDYDKSENDIAFQKPKPKLLDGEIIISEGNKVLYFPNVTSKTKGLLGNLFVTNFRFLFDAYEDDDSNENVGMHQINLLLGDHGCCLTNIETLYQLRGEKKKQLFQDSQITEKVKSLQVVCKNMKVFTFNFDQSPISQGENIAKTLLYHAFPGRHQLLFAYDYSGRNLTNEKHGGVNFFSKKSEWEDELNRTCSSTASKWRISTQNQRFQMSTSLPQWLIVPHSLLDYDFVTASQSFRCNRPPIWTWSSPNGAAIIRTADLLPTITERTQENRMLENVRKCHPQLKGPSIKDLDKDLPSISELFQSYIKLKELCTPASYRQFKLQDLHFYTKLENSKWLQYVSSCMKIVVEATREIEQGRTVVLQESDGRDTSAIISSLIQLALDPHTRSIVGFQSLIQKEWIALGHPFCKRLGLLRTNPLEQSPVFLLFLDCVWQLQTQFPESFEFTETYLTTLWDSTHISLFDTFLFDCEKDRFDAFTNQNEKLEPRSIWNWSVQFSDSDVELFFNPLYKLAQLQNFKQIDFGSFKKNSCTLTPEFNISYLDLWTQCYFRWLPLLSIRSGGKPCIDIIHRQLVTDIELLTLEIQDLMKKNLGERVIGSYNKLNYNSNDNNNSNSTYKSNKKNNFINYSGSSCSKNSGTDKSDMEEIKLTEHCNKNCTFKNIGILIKKTDRIDNFFPFSLGNVNCLSGALANTSNLSEYETSSVFNLID